MLPVRRERYRTDFSGRDEGISMFSVVVPAYNAEKFVAAAIDSVLSQTCPDFELIVVDDGSEDGTAGVVRGYEDPRVRCIVQENGGVSAARNAGIRASAGEYVCFLDADDLWRENHLQVLSDLIGCYPDCGFFITGHDIRLTNGRLVHRFAEQLKRVEGETFRSDDGYRMILDYGYFFNTNTVCCRRALFDRTGLFEVGVKNGEDDDMWFRMFACSSVAVSKAVTTVYTRENSGATARRMTDTQSIFYNRVEGLLTGGELSQERKESLILLAERHKLSQCRKLILSGRKKDALKILRGIDVRKVSRKKYAETLLALLVLTKLVNRHVDRRDEGYYQ